MLGKEPGSGPVGSGTLISVQGEVRVYLNAPQNGFVFDDHSVHGVGRRSKRGVISGTWEPSCFRPCAERGVFFMRRVS